MYISRATNPRTRRRLGSLSAKIYDIVAAGRRIDEVHFIAGLRQIEEELEPVWSLPHSTRLGFAIQHAGAGADYLVAAWWGNDNELFVRTYVSGEDRIWQERRDTFSFCLWDLEVIAFERSAWIETMYSGTTPNPENYLRLTFSKTATVNSTSG